MNTLSVKGLVKERVPQYVLLDHPGTIKVCAREIRQLITVDLCQCRLETCDIDREVTFSPLTLKEFPCPQL